jgi:hypothetical protein
LKGTGIMMKNFISKNTLDLKIDNAEPFNFSGMKGQGAKVGYNSSGKGK